ncbi:hypothetical protein [Streptomyces sp. Rer75]|uniref:hypothetical protein n=1 Tax=Streptomyces sp. Rer75 TaxID=2750011 RepID=UPI0015CF8E76|nr:hypothetical protein [Streptomyces sp. Rer75]QLH23983.1 hypothetical protein HYQ63_27945 [Streptomyces sp. Rer75]
MTGPAPGASGARREQPSAPASAHERGAKARRGSVDPVRALMHRHRELCARAVDPLEIAAGLEAHGVTDRTAARFRHRDVFSLAEELYARVPRDGDGGDDAPRQESAPARPRIVRAALGLLRLLPGALAAATVIGAHRTGAVAVGAAGAVLTAGALWPCLRRGPLGTGGRRGRTSRRAGRSADRSANRFAGLLAALFAALPGALCTGWLLAYAACGDWLLAGLTGRTDGAPGPYDPGPFDPGPYDPAAACEAAVVLGLAVAPAAWCARWFAVRARRRLAASSGLEEFAAGVRPLCAAAALAFLLALPPLVLTARLTVPGAAADPTAEAGVAALAGLLFLARLLAVHGFRAAAATGTAVACAAEAAVLGAAGAARLPGCAALGEPVRRLAAAHGTAAVPAVACGAAALALLVYACAALSRASAHTAPPRPPHRHPLPSLRGAPP